METLRDLNKLAKEVVENFNLNFNPSDCKIPQAFKDKVKSLKSFSLVYNDYSVIVKGNGTSSKDAYIPNQTFYMASFFIEYWYELSKYRKKVISIVSESGLPTNEFTPFFTHEREEGKKDIANGTDKFVKMLDDIDYQEEDREYLIKFVTDYSWWSGNKTIDRNDFFNSSVLSIMGLSAAANSTMGLIVDHLTQNPDDNQLLLNQGGVTHIKINTTYPLQQIFYGAPGTGKSFKIDDIIKNGHYNSVRTTFHPDSDYSTFVGAYKPVMEDVRQQVVPVVINNGISLNQNEGSYEEKRIVYKFVKQAFTKAYLSSWRKYVEDPESPQPQFLVIEEINRGNCAQIFGDLFQLLDRSDNGFSSYPIEADTDLQKEVARSFKEDKEYKLSSNISIEGAVKDYTSNYEATLSEDVQEGRILLLPPNLYIWATMNTSDQSLFPIDSAFKRRWDWKYIPINTRKEQWGILVKGKNYSWSSFLENINDVINEMTSSEDKQLGFYFCKAKDDIVSIETFVNKVLFYLWNDVFKDYNFDKGIFKYGEGNNEKTIEFRRFFKIDGTINELMVETFLKNLQVETIDEEDAAEDNSESGSTKNKFTLNGEQSSLRDISKNVVLNYANNNPSLSAQQVRDYFITEFKGIGIAHIVETEEEYHERDGQPTQARTVSEITIPTGEKLYVTTQWRAKSEIDNFMNFMRRVNEKGLGTIALVEDKEVE